MQQRLSWSSIEQYFRVTKMTSYALITDILGISWKPPKIRKNPSHPEGKPVKKACKHLAFRLDLHFLLSAASIHTNMKMAKRISHFQVPKIFQRGDFVHHLRIAVLQKLKKQGLIPKMTSLLLSYNFITD